MSRTMTISSWPASNVTVRCRAGSSCSPAKISAYIARDPVGRATQPVAVGVLTDRDQDLAHRALRSGRGLRLAQDCSVGSSAHSPLPGVADAERRWSRTTALRRRFRDDGRRGSRRPRPLRASRARAARSARRSSAARCIVRIRAGHGVRAVEQHPHLLVDARRDLLGVVGGRREVAAEEHLALRLAEAHRAEPLAHAELGDHLPGDRRGAVDVVSRAGGGVGEDELLGGPAAEQHRQLRRASSLRRTRNRSSVGSDSVYPSVWPRGMIVILCTGSVSGTRGRRARGRPRGRR